MNTLVDTRYCSGNRLCLDFVNLGITPGEAAVQAPGWDELIDFLAVKQIVTEEKSESLRKLPKVDTASARLLLRHAMELATAFRQSFRAILRGHCVVRDWVEPINRILRVTEGHDELGWDGRAWQLGFVGREEGLDWLLAAIARSGAELIAEGPSGKLRQCGDPRCQIFFYDDSKTHRRRWCSMALCGNRSKVAAFARRHAGEQARAHHA